MQIQGKGIDELKRFIADHPDWLVIDNSQLEQWEACPRKYKYQFIDMLAREASYDAEFGNLLHELIADWYKTGGQRIGSTRFTQICQGFYNSVTDALLPQASRLSIFTSNHASAIYQAYTERYTPDFEVYEIANVETVYFRELTPGVLWLSKPDLLLRQKADGQLINMDIKHSVWMFNQSLLAFDRQFIGQAYATGSTLMLKTFIHSMVPQRAGRPPEARIYRDLQPTDSELFREWIDETMLMVEPILKAKQIGVFPKRSPRACTGFNRLCEFVDLCELGKTVGAMMIESRERGNPNAYLGL